MLVKNKMLNGFTLKSLDGEIGKVKEFYFDDYYWAIRYLVVDTGDWLTSRQVLISPYALIAVMKEERQISVNLTKKQIEDSPSLDTDKPVSLQFEETYYGYYGWPIYWGGQNMWGVYPDIMRDSEKYSETAQNEKMWDPNLRSTKAVSGNYIHALDGDIGHVADFIIDEETWAIRYLVINTQNWWPGKNVLVSPEWIERISWNDSKVFVNLTREKIKNSPEYHEGSLLDRDYEIELHSYYNRPGYWVNKQKSMKNSL